MDTRKYLPRRYTGAHPCMSLVVDVLESEYHIKGIPTVSPEVSLRQRSAVALELLSHRCAEVTRSQAREGDIVLIRIGSLPAHVGILINERYVMHYPDDDIGVVIEALDSPWICNRIVGYYRPIL